MASASRSRAITLPFSWSYSSIGFPVRRAVTSVVSCFEAYDGARDAAPRADSAAARAGQHVMAAAIVPAHQIGLDGPLTERHDHRILNVKRRDIAMRPGRRSCRLNMIPNGDLGKGFGLTLAPAHLQRKIGASSSPCHWSRSWNMRSIDLRSAPIETPVGPHGLDDHHLGKVLARE